MMGWTPGLLLSCGPLCACSLGTYLARKNRTTIEELTMEKLTIAIIGFLVSFGAMWFMLGMAYEKASRMNEETEDE